MTNISASSTKHSRIGQDDVINTLPIISKTGLTYYLNSEINSTRKLELYKIALITEFQTLLNSKFNNRISGGVELTLFEILLLRGGYYTMSIDDRDYSINRDKVESITYGVGLNLPLSKFMKRPLEIVIDYTQLPQPSYIYNRTWEDFKSFNMAIRYQLKKFK